MPGVGLVTVSERRSTRAGEELVTQHLRDQEGELQRLPGVQPRVAGGLVAAVEVLVADLHGPAEALGDVLTGELDVDAAGPGAQGPVDVEEAEHLRSEEHTSELQSRQYLVCRLLLEKKK